MDDVVLVTGATSGVGRATARRFGERGDAVILTGRDRARGRAAVREVEAAGGEATFHRVDFADLGAVSDLAATVAERDRLDVLVNNAALSTNEVAFTDDGYELTMAVNHLAPYLLTHDLFALLTESAPSRVVTVASRIHRDGERPDDVSAERAGLDAYRASKLANVCFARELGERLTGSGVVACSLHPGGIPGSRLYRDASLPVRLGTRIAAALPFVGSTPEDGADRVLYAVDAEYENGAYLEDDEVVDPAPAATDSATRRAVWERSAEAVGVDPAWP